VGATTPAQSRANWARAAWIHGDGLHSGTSWYADVKLLAEAYDAACAKLWEEARRVDAAALRCSYLEPALPEPPRRAPPDTTRTQAGSLKAASDKLGLPSKTVAVARVSAVGGASTTPSSTGRAAVVT
jgi:hypothetical protein